MKWRWAICLLLFVSSAQAQMYRWVDANGRIHFSDKPPPAKYLPKQHDVRDGENESSSGLGYALSEAMKNFPVTIYTGNECAPCDEGRSYLKKRGIPFTEKTIKTNDDIAKLKEAGGGGQLPFLTVGRLSHTGFVESEWNATLTSAGYPASNQLPPNYKNPDPLPAAPPPVPVEKPAAEPAPAAPPPPPQGDAPPGFRF
ncbi:MAG: glutaredoxin family protein [Oxalobacter sp.]|nr:MAG: glutaredoxin family protein [Oxalobacter sp.]